MSYVGKDVVNHGCGLILDAERAWPAIAHCSRKNVAKARAAGVEVRRVEATPEALEAVRRIWYHPDDPNFPTEGLPEQGALYHATLDGELCGGMILLPVGTHLFLNNLTANERGKTVQAQSLLLWTAVEDYTGSPWRYLDIGVSYRPNLLAFFERWASFRYPVIFHPPAVSATLDFTPLRSLATRWNADRAVDLRAWTGGRPATVLPSAAIAEKLLESTGHGSTRPVLPDPNDASVQCIDLTRVLPTAFGALVLGVAWTPKELWDGFGCYDEIKTRAIERLLSDPEHAPARIAAERERRHAILSQAFDGEDLEVLPPAPGIDSFALRCADAVEAERLAERYGRFQVRTRLDGAVLHLPCHQGTTDAELELLYAIYRGHLNLCSEWLPTAVRGRLKTA